MSEDKIRISCGDLEFEATGCAHLNEAEMFIDLLREKMGGEIRQLAEPVKTVYAEHDVVAIYDDLGIPSIMHRFKRVSNKELFGGQDRIHPAFVIDGKVHDELYISVYENCEIKSRPYSLPFQKAWVNVTNDEFAVACFSKGKGWHMMTGAEWGLLALISYGNGTLPHGNTNAGLYHADESESGTLYDSNYTLTGSGPATWTHDHTPTGVHDLCGNHWEMVRGVRMKDGRLQAVRNNDAALNIDLSENAKAWADVLDNDGKPVYVHAFDNKIVFDTDRKGCGDYNGVRWGNAEINCKSEQLMELALFAGDKDSYLYVDSTEGEWFLIRGGGWSNGSVAGVFLSNLGSARSFSGTDVGGRSAFYYDN